MYKHISQAMLFILVNVGSINLAFKKITTGRRKSVPADPSNTEIVLLLDERFFLSF
jgi:hypothetical protein